jgi:formate C-acetyltransferase
MVATPYINLNKGLEYIFGGGEKIFGNDFMRERVQSYDLSSLDTFEKFYSAVKETIDNILVGELSAIQDYILYRKRYTSLPLASCFINDCLAMGKDAANDGARYSFIYPCFPGFINLIDSVVAIRRVVYEEKRATLEEIRDAIKGNFEGEERLRHA